MAPGQRRDAGRRCRFRPPAAAEPRHRQLEQLLRSVAEFGNYRKRTEREIDNARSSPSSASPGMVTVGDALEAGIAAVQPSRSRPVEGAQATLRQLQRAFDKAGIKIIDPAGQPFRSAWHEAMTVQESRDQPAKTVLTGSKRAIP